MSYPSFRLKVVLCALSVLLPKAILAGTGDSENLQADYSKTALPILRQSCFSCHGPKPQSTDDIQNPALKKQTFKMIIKAQKHFPMADTFPFPDSDDLKDDLKTFSKSLRKGWMPPALQRTLHLGQPLSDKDKKTLLDWAARTQKALN
jgi:hypothetical protein